MSKPEVLAPVGDYEALQAALQGGADAVYFGLSEGFNARARAQNFSLERLEALVHTVHQAGAKVYLTLNTLIFPSELERLPALLKAIAAAQVDALIIQDLAVALLAARYAPQVALHASTQMSISDSWGVRWAQERLHCQRVVVARELSAREIAAIKERVSCQLEVFALGALCVSFSGQCLASLTWGGRSANRGQCAQPCRLPFRYFSLSHGAPLDFQKAPPALSAPAHLLSPGDLLGLEQIAPLAQAGVDSLKIEGRLKGAPYVYLATQTVRRWVDAHFNAQGEFQKPSSSQKLECRQNLRDLTLTFCRGFTPGFLKAYDHQHFIQPGYPQHRGQLLGQVLSKKEKSVRIKLAPPSERGELTPYPLLPQAGMGVLFLPLELGSDSERRVGGPIFKVVPTRAKDEIELVFGRPGPDLQRVRAGEAVYLTSSPAVNQRVERALKEPLAGRRPLHLKIEGRLGEPLSLSLEVDGQIFSAQSATPLATAQSQGLTPQTIVQKFGELKGTPYHLASWEAHLEEGLFLPLSELKPLRRQLLANLTQPSKDLASTPAPAPSPAKSQPTYPFSGPTLRFLCRTREQVRAALQAGARFLELEALRPESLSALVGEAQTERGVYLSLVTPRIQKEEEAKYLEELLSFKPQSLLVRTWGAFQYLTSTHPLEELPALEGDFSLNITNQVSAKFLLREGWQTLTLSDDLPLEESLRLLRALEEERSADLPLNKRLVFTLYRQAPTFHTQHCSYAYLLSSGKDRLTCGQPCLHKDLYLLDRRQYAHPLKVDHFCRNTLFHAQPLQRQKDLPALQGAGLEHFRVEFLNEEAAQVAKIVGYYRHLVESK